MSLLFVGFDMEACVYFSVLFMEKKYFSNANLDKSESEKDKKETSEMLTVG